MISPFSFYIGNFPWIFQMGHAHSLIPSRCFLRLCVLRYSGAGLGLHVSDQLDAHSGNTFSNTSHTKFALWQPSWLSRISAETTQVCQSPSGSIRQMWCWPERVSTSYVCMYMHEYIFICTHTIGLSRIIWHVHARARVCDLSVRVLRVCSACKREIVAHGRTTKGSSRGCQKSCPRLYTVIIRWPCVNEELMFRVWEWQVVECGWNQKCSDRVKFVQLGRRREHFVQHARQGSIWRTWMGGTKSDYKSAEDFVVIREKFSPDVVTRFFGRISFCKRVRTILWFLDLSVYWQINIDLYSYICLQIKMDSSTCHLPHHARLSEFDLRIYSKCY